MRKILAGILGICIATQVLHATADTNWNQLPIILSRIIPPSFPNVDYNIIDHGASTDGVTLSTAAINNAIDTCSKYGGGRVVIPAGTFVTGAVKLKSNVNLYISNGATLKFSTTFSDFLPVVFTRFEGVELYNYSPFIYAFEDTNIAITGSGTLNGQASYANWWAWKTSGAADVASLNAMGEAGTPVADRIFGSGHYIRPNFIQPYRCANILIDSINIINSPMWEVHPVLCTNVTVRNITVTSHGPNNDGCNPECSKDVLIKNCSFNTGDDCIAIKSGRNNDGRRVNVPSQNIVVQGCTMADGHGGVVLGSECSGSIRNVFVEDCYMSSANLDRALRFKTNSVRGGILENVFMRNCTIDQVASEIVIVDMYYQEGDAGSFTPIVRNIEMKNITSSSSPRVFNFNCYNRTPVTNIKVIDCNFTGVSGSNILNNVCKLQINNSFINGSVPLIPTPAAGYIEAGAYSAKQEWGWSNVLAGYNGNGYMEFVDSSNAISWIVTVTQNEIDTLIVRYANVNATNRPCSILVNGSAAGQFTCAPTATSWTTEKKPITLNTGSNTITLVASNNAPGAYIDRFSLKFGSAIITHVQQTEAYELSCIPNVIADKATIMVNVPEAVPMQLELYDINGTLIRTFTNDIQGKNTMTFERNGLRSGMYMLVLHSGGITRTRKIIIE